jgi:hypothetical protein
MAVDPSIPILVDPERATRDIFNQKQLLESSKRDFARIYAEITTRVPAPTSAHQPVRDPNAIPDSVSSGV